MKHEIWIEPDTQLAFIRYRGEVHLDESIELLRRIIIQPEWTPRCSRILLYEDALLGQVTSAELERARVILSEILRDAYQGAAHYLAHVCDDPLKTPILDFWVTAGNRDYPAHIARMNTEREARAWIEEQRAAET